jgi:hypothetical protein
VELDFFERVIALAKQYDVLVVHDLAYADITYDGWKAPSIMQVPGAKDIAVEFFTLSKSYNMAGWRIGFMVGNAELVNALARIKSYHDYGTFTPLQVAAIAALEGDQQCVRDIAMRYQRRRLCALRLDRKPGSHPSGTARHQGHVPCGWTVAGGASKSQSCARCGRHGARSSPRLNGSPRCRKSLSTHSPNATARAIPSRSHAALSSAPDKRWAMPQV